MYIIYVILYNKGFSIQFNRRKNLTIIVKKRYFLFAISEVYDFIQMLIIALLYLRE